MSLRKDTVDTTRVEGGRVSPLYGLIGGVWSATGKSPAWPLLVILCVFFAFQSPIFLSLFNINIILSQAALTGVLAIGLTPLVISGNVDFSVGAIAALGTCVAVVINNQLGFFPAIALTLIVCALFGLLNGLIVERLGLSSIIVTIASGTALKGLTFIIFGSGTIMATGSLFLDIGYYKVAGISVSVILFLLLAVVLALMLRLTVHGAHTFAIGGNRQAALDAGVNVEMHVLANFAISGLMAGVCGIILVTGLGAGAPSLAPSYELWAIIAVVLGGTRLAGGGGTIAGTVAAALSLTVLRNGMNLMQIDARWFLIVLGSSLIVALILDRMRSGEPETAE